MTTNTGHVTIDRALLDELLHHAAFAAHLVGHLDDGAHADLIGQLGDHVDAVVHSLTELLGSPGELSERAAVPFDREAYDGAPMLTSSTGGAP